MSASDSFWLRAWELLAAVGVIAVIVGILGEGSELLVKLVGKKKYKQFQAELDSELRWFLAVLVKFVRPRILEVETVAFSLVVIGLVAEFWGGQKAQDILGRNNAQLNLQAVQLGRTNAQLWAANLVLQTNVNETKTRLANAEARLNESILNLKKENLPMDIGDQYSFVNGLKPMAGIQVELRSAVDTKSQETAESLFSTFFMASWPVINRAFIGDIGEQGVVIGYGNDKTSEQAAFLLLKLLTERDVPSKIIDDPMGTRVRGVPTNAIIVAVMRRPSQLQADLMVVQAKQRILSAQESPVFSRMMELSSKRYVSGSKEMAAAQAEYNDLGSQYVKLENEKKNLDEQERNLFESLDKETFGTNSPGTHISGNVYNNAPPGFSPVKIGGTGTNSPKVFMRNEHVNPVPLQ